MGAPWPCVFCQGSGCEECGGGGVITHIPYADRPWDEIVPGLWQGGHDCQPKGAPPMGNCIVTDEFDVVFSLHHRLGFGPDPGVRHFSMSIGDEDLDPDRHTELDVMAEEVASRVRGGQKVLVRCQAGLNRSGLVVALTLIKLGWPVEQAVAHQREVRSPYVLCNPSFTAYLKEVPSIAEKSQRPS